MPTFPRMFFTALLILSLGAMGGDTNAPASRSRQEKTLVLMGSLMQADIWRGTGIQLREGQRVSIAAAPLDGLQKPTAFRKDSFVFRVGQMGSEYVFDTAGRARWHQTDKWIDESVMRFTADASAELVYRMKQSNKFSVKITVE